MKTLGSIMIWAVLLYSGYCGILFLLQRQMLFPRNLVDAPETPRTGISGMEIVWLETGVERVEAWYIPPLPGTRQGPAPAVIFGHGNAEILDTWPEEFLPYTQMGIGLLLVEYPGYGRSSGAPSQESVTRAFISAYDWLAERKDVDSDRILLQGRSLGGGAVCQLAKARPSRAMILLSTFTSARSFTKRYLVPGFLMLDPFDNLSVVAAYDHPLLIVHGEQDDVIPFSHARELAAAAPKGRMVSYPCGHNDCPPDYTAFWKEITAFLLETGMIAPPPDPDPNERFKRF